MTLFSSRKETTLVFLIAFSAASFSLLPTIWAWIHTPDGMWFTGVNSYFDPWDINTYFSAMRQGFNGSWLYRNLYQATSTAVPIHLVYLFLGHSTRVFGLSIPFVYHSASFVLSIVFLVAVYLFVRFFLRDTFWSIVCLFLIALGGGFGYFGFFEGVLLPDTAYPDATVFQTLHMQHLVLDELLFITILLFSYKALAEFNWRYSLLSALLSVFLVFIHPYSVLVLDVVLGIFLISLCLKDKKWQRIRLILPLFFVSFVSVGYLYKVLYLDNWFADPLPLGNVVAEYRTPAIPLLILGYGLIAAFSFIGSYRLWKEQSVASLFILSWFFGQLLVLYSPFSWQRITIKSFFIVVCLVAVWGMRSLHLRKNWVALAMVLFFSSLTNITLQTYTIALAYPGNSWVYLTGTERDVLQWLERNSSDNVVLAPLILSTTIPANSSNFVYLAFQDARFDHQKHNSLTDFYQGSMGNPEKFLQENNISYVVYPLIKYGLGAEFDDSREVYRNENFVVHKTQ